MQPKPLTKNFEREIVSGMNYEAYCADILKVTEGEMFISVGDEKLAPLLNPTFQADTQAGKALSLPDLLSTRSQDGKVTYRLREVKYKLEERLVEKALQQLQSGVLHMERLFSQCLLDRLEIVIPLHGRRLKKEECKFLGLPLATNRFHLRKGQDEPVYLDLRFSTPVTVLLL